MPKNGHNGGTYTADYNGIRNTIAENTLRPEVVIWTSDAGPNAMFFTCLFLDEPMGFEFLQDVGLLRSKVQCNTCDGDLTWCVDSSGSRRNQRLVQVRFAALH